MNPGSRDAGNDANVDVDVTCKNKDFTKLSVSQGTYLAHAVQVSYNKVHGDAANDDSVLDKVFFYAIKKNTKEEANRLGLIHHVSLGLSGWWGCRLCPRHDDFMIDAVADSGEALKAWEAALVVTLKQSPFEYFNNIQTCDIKLRPHSLAQEADVEGSSTLGGLVTNE